MMLPSAAVRDRFRGCLTGAVVGDALGALFEGNYWNRVVDPAVVRKATHAVAEGEIEDGQLSYTDDTAMARCVARSLLQCNAFDAVDMAERFVREYYAEPNRGYGGSVATVFKALRDTAFADVFLPARRQFNGQGSYGNGAAMRVCPTALFAYKDRDGLAKVAANSALLTHSHPNAVNGAVMLAAAVQFALLADNNSPLDANDFLHHLISVVQQLEPVPPKQTRDGWQGQARYVTRHVAADPDLSPFTHRLNAIELLLAKRSPTKEVASTLGTGVSAVDAVSAALFAFLHCRSQSFQDLVEYAISLGGDTDTIATMAAAIGGAFNGMSSIPDGWLKACEGIPTAIELADRLFDKHRHDSLAV